MAYLIVQHQGGRDQEFPLTKSPTILGRAASCDLQVVDPKVSRQHCQLEQRGPHWYLVNIKSRNNTWMGKQAIDEVLLIDGDEFRIGGTRLVFFSETNPTEVFNDTPVWS